MKKKFNIQRLFVGGVEQTQCNCSLSSVSCYGNQYCNCSDPQFAQCVKNIPQYQLNNIDRNRKKKQKNYSKDFLIVPYQLYVNLLNKKVSKLIIDISQYNKYVKNNKIGVLLKNRSELITLKIKKIQKSSKLNNALKRASLKNTLLNVNSNKNGVEILSNYVNKNSKEFVILHLEL